MAVFLFGTMYVTMASAALVIGWIFQAAHHYHLLRVGLVASWLPGYYILDLPIVNAKPLKLSMLYHISLNNAISANAEIL
jgi:hypothetical protein